MKGRFPLKIVGSSNFRQETLGLCRTRKRSSSAYASY